MNRLSEGYKRAVDQNWGRTAKIGFLGKNRDQMNPIAAQKLKADKFDPERSSVVAATF